MLQLFLTLLGLLFPSNNVNTFTISQDTPMVQSTDIGVEGDTGGDTIPLPPKK